MLINAAAAGGRGGGGGGEVAAERPCSGAAPHGLSCTARCFDLCGSRHVPTHVARSIEVDGPFQLL